MPKDTDPNASSNQRVGTQYKPPLPLRFRQPHEKPSCDKANYIFYSRRRGPEKYAPARDRARRTPPHRRVPPANKSGHSTPVHARASSPIPHATPANPSARPESSPA